MVHAATHSLAATWGQEYSKVLANPPLGKKQRLLFGTGERDKLSLDLFWIKDECLTDTDSRRAPDSIAAEIAGDLAAAPEQFIRIAARLRAGANV